MKIFNKHSKFMETATIGIIAMIVMSFIVFIIYAGIGTNNSIKEQKKITKEFFKERNEKVTKVEAVDSDFDYDYSVITNKGNYQVSFDNQATFQVGKIEKVNKIAQEKINIRK